MSDGGGVAWASGATDRGLVRESNEDAWGASLADQVFVVADGVGGQVAGEVASRIAVDTILEMFASWGAPQGPGSCAPGSCIERGRLESAIQLANVRIQEVGRRDATRRGMGTTVAALRTCREVAHLAHVGDSRIYRRRAGRLEMLTTDHSLFAGLSESPYPFHPNTIAYAKRFENVITRALGIGERLEVEMRCVPIEPGDEFLLCTDGLHHGVDLEAIARALETEADADGRVEALIRIALEAGGDDNVTILLAGS